MHQRCKCCAVTASIIAYAIALTKTPVMQQVNMSARKFIHDNNFVDVEPILHFWKKYPLTKLQH